MIQRQRFRSGGAYVFWMIVIILLGEYSASMAQQSNDFTTKRILDVGAAPHQISFSFDGQSAYIAAAGSDRITVVDCHTLEISDTLPVDGTPLGVIELPSHDALAVSAFRSDHIAQVSLSDGAIGKQLTTGQGSSLFVGPFGANLYLIPTETANKVRVFDAKAFSMQDDYPTGARPFPPGVTSDGRKAFVPNYDDGTVTVIDLWNKRVLTTVTVGAHPSGATVLPDDINVAVVVRGENKIAIINTASHLVVDSLQDGIGKSPFSFVVSTDKRLAYVNNTADNDISVVDLAIRKVIAHIATGKIPIVMAVHPQTDELWVGCEGSDELYIIETPKREIVTQPSHRSDTADKSTIVAVMGMIHDSHRTSKTWGLKQVAETIRNFKPDVIFAEIPPDRWERAWRDWSERGVIEEPRIKRFPEYTDVLLPLKSELGFAVEPCAAWTKEMSDLRNARIKEFEESPLYAEQYAAYQKADSEVTARHKQHPIDEEDPRVIHSEAYDRRVREELEPYEKYMNDIIGPGGWTNINNAHLALIEKALQRHKGQRILITFGAGHKYKFLERLRQRKDITLENLRPYLPDPE